MKAIITSYCRHHQGLVRLGRGAEYGSLEPVTMLLFEPIIKRIAICERTSVRTNYITNLSFQKIINQKSSPYTRF